MAIHTTVSSWRAEMQRRKEQTHDSLATTVIKIATTVGTKLVHRTPIYTGRAAGSWSVSFGSPAPSDIGPGMHTGAKEVAVANIAATLSEGVTRTNPFRKIFFNNTVPYIDVLERGHSSQAPGGFVRITMMEVRRDLRARIQ